MAGRYSQWRRLRGDLDRPELVDYGKRLLGYLDNQRKLSGNMSAFIKRTLPDGSVVMARFNGDQPEVYVQGVEGGGVEDVILMYVGSTGGLRIINLNTKSIAKTITGVENYYVDAVRGKNVVYMNNGRTVAKLDLEALTAFGVGYTANWIETPYLGTPELHTDGIVMYPEAVPSPDGNRVLVHFEAVGEDEGSTVVIKEAIGGYKICDGETMLPLRDTIRMSFRSTPHVWHPDSSHFYISASITNDEGDITVDGYRGVSESQSDYIATFTNDGALVGTTLVSSWDFEPDTGFSRSIFAMDVEGDKLYVVANTQGFAFNGASLLVYDIANATPSLIQSATVQAGIGNITSIAVRNGTVFACSSSGDVLAIKTGDEGIEVSSTANHGFATGEGLNDSWRRTLQAAPIECTTTPAKDMKFIGTRVSAAVHEMIAFNVTSAAPKYRYRWTDDAPVSLSFYPAARYRLVHGGYRSTRRKAA